MFCVGVNGTGVNCTKLDIYDIYMYICNICMYARMNCIRIYILIYIYHVVHMHCVLVVIVGIIHNLF